MKYGDSWLINIDELYSYLQYGYKKNRKLNLPLKKVMLTSGQIVRQFIEADPNTIIRKPNFRRFCKANNINCYMDSFLKNPLYDFNDFLMAVNPKGIIRPEPMPLLRRFEPAVNELRVTHHYQEKNITWKLAFKMVNEGLLFRERYGKGWIINYKEFEEQIMKALDEEA